MRIRLSEPPSEEFNALVKLLDNFFTNSDGHFFTDELADLMFDFFADEGVDAEVDERRRRYSAKVRQEEKYPT